MSNSQNVEGTNNILIQDVKDSSITINVAGQVEEIRREFDAFRQFLQDRQIETVETKESRFEVDEINEANFGVVLGRKSFNQDLSKRLIEALADHGNELAEDFLEDARDEAEDWHTRKHLNAEAKGIISSSFVGVLGIQLRDLMSIGNEAYSEDKLQKYLENAEITLKRALELLCFTLLSAYWDHLRELGGSGEKPTLSDAQSKAIRRFFNSKTERSISRDQGLLSALVELFDANGLPYPLEEMNGIQTKMEASHRFQQAIEGLQQVQRDFETGRFNTLTCHRAESHLTTLLEELIFLSDYKMVSIKRISYDKMRNTPIRYLHRYASLGIDNKANEHSESVEYVEGPIGSSNAVLLYKGKFKGVIDLFPFIIDLNALADEGGARVCFFGWREREDESLNYRVLEDNSKENISFQDIRQYSRDIKEILLDTEKRSALKRDEVFLHFQQAEKDLLGTK